MSRWKILKINTLDTSIAKIKIKIMKVNVYVKKYNLHINNYFYFFLDRISKLNCSTSTVK